MVWKEKGKNCKRYIVFDIEVWQFAIARLELSVADRKFDVDDRKVPVVNRKVDVLA
ncbi:hypothetical protein JCM15579A_09110 [Marinifilum fragile]